MAEWEQEVREFRCHETSLQQRQDTGPGTQVVLNNTYD